MVVTSALAFTCGLIALAAAVAAGAELTRGPSGAELRQAAATEVAQRWQTWPAGKIFPETIGYKGEQGGSERARRVGISSRIDCAAAVDAPLRAAVRAAGCLAIIRATYLDELQGIVVTLGVAAFPDPAAAATAKAVFPQAGKASPGLRALAFTGTVSDHFTAAVRQAGTIRQAGPYVVMTTAGQVDGRPARAIARQRPTLFTFTADLADSVAMTLATPATPDCAGEGWTC
ncbi:hypothetical protein J5X84_32860 [Streptosporangiaceae bacterium NEAU-GS5]|nr:hypothetical protein [Streptosporangiaceae bacterium NEAU-GS5]